MDEGVFKAGDVALANLSSVSREMSALLEARTCELSFIADEIAETVVSLIGSGLTVIDALTLLGEEHKSVLDGGAEYGGVLPPTFRDAFIASPELADTALLSVLIIEKLSERGVSVTEADFLPDEPSDETFTYLRNPLSDEAYDVFSQDFSDPRVFYSASLKDACVAVAEGKSGYCILPFEEGGGVRVPIISDLAARLDLKISQVTPVFGFEGTADMKYALLKRGFVIPPRDEDTDRYLELKLRFDQAAVSRLLPIAEALGTSLYRINTMSGEGGSFVCCVLSDKGGGFAPLLLYLTVFFGGFIPVGIYKNLE